MEMMAYAALIGSEAACSTGLFFYLILENVHTLNHQWEKALQRFFHPQNIDFLWVAVATK
ncbi:hypothetical protein LT85_0737 [Collimonas arenae]|uniref:Uncharacterized protein n=1 Tax=Collimonas arenae TaxID=279058 RepID=A0A0A1FAK2_9BURK|nr:hypothetical protein [Collimonas arenae]AIY39897.1 hypothetical protein LT85_0737 [Collimonas arenae]